MGLGGVSAHMNTNCKKESLSKTSCVESAESVNLSKHVSNIDNETITRETKLLSKPLNYDDKTEMMFTTPPSLDSQKDINKVFDKINHIHHSKPECTNPQDDGEYPIDETSDDDVEYSDNQEESDDEGENEMEWERRRLYAQKLLGLQ